MQIEPLGNIARTHTCGALRAEDVGKDVVLLGWVHRVRDLGSLVFIDVRDRHGVTQVVVRDNDALVADAKRLRSEFVVAVMGRVEHRAPDTVNTNPGTPKTRPAFFAPTLPLPVSRRSCPVRQRTK